LRISCVMGTRPEIIKLAPVIDALQKAPRVSVSVILTGQHRELAAQALKAFRVPIDRDLGLMKTGQSPVEVAAGILHGLERAWRARPPSAVLVQGDTTSAMVAGLTAFYNRIPVGHVEAGLRTGDLAAPYPEELNRKLIAAFARWNFAPTKRARRNLLREGVSPTRVYVTGNTIVDALHLARRRIASMSPSALESLRREIAPDKIGLRRRLAENIKGKLVVVTLHRRESFGVPLRTVLQALRRIAFRLPDTLIVFPVHPNPNVQVPVRECLEGLGNVACVAPLTYLPFVWLLGQARVVITDSGGIQEECAVLGKPTLVTREVTERPEAVEGGSARLVGTDSEALVSHTIRLVRDNAFYARMTRSSRLFGDSRAGIRIARILVRALEEAE
jgi:UDP-N-acetylglucosamine 2-epimerase (non-hydrolysing)